MPNVEKPRQVRPSAADLRAKKEAAAKKRAAKKKT